MKLSEKQEKEKAQILSGQFLHYPLLPMKSWKDGDLECGIMIAPRYNVIVLANMFFLTDRDYIKKAKLIMYADMDEMLLDGWVGD